MSEERILIVDDDKKVVEVVEIYLENYGYRTIAAYDGEEAFRLWKEEKPDLVVLDILMPNMDGLEFCNKVREESDIPIIMLSAKSEEADKLAGFIEGADDYMTKPFSPRELVARIGAVLRRRNAGVESAGRSIAQGPLVIHQGEHKVEVNGNEVHMTPMEFNILSAMASNPGIVYSRRQLIELSQGDFFEGYERTVDSHIRNLRKKIEEEAEDWNFVETVHRVGYKFEAKKKD